MMIVHRPKRPWLIRLVWRVAVWLDPGYRRRCDRYANELLPSSILLSEQIEHNQRTLDRLDGERP